MSASFYSPYESNTTQGYGDVFKERAKNAFSVGNAAKVFLLNPFNFSMDRGVKVPFSGIASREIWKGAGAEIRQGQLGKLSGRVIKGLRNPKRALSEQGSTVTRLRGNILEGNKIGTLARRNIKNQIQHSGLFNTAAVSGVPIDNLSGRAGTKLTNKLIKHISKESGSTEAGISRFIERSFGKSAARPQTKHVSQLSSKISEIVKTSTADISNISKGATMAHRAKWGIRGIKSGLALGKITAFGVLAGLAFSTALSISEPIGAAAMTSIDKGLSLYNNRFNVEMGGGLNKGFLSFGAATERQRAVQAISKAYINGRSAIGQESFYLHQ